MKRLTSIWQDYLSPKLIISAVNMLMSFTVIHSLSILYPAFLDDAQIPIFILMLSQYAWFAKTKTPFNFPIFSKVYIDNEKIKFYRKGKEYSFLLTSIKKIEEIEWMIPKVLKITYNDNSVIRFMPEVHLLKQFSTHPTVKDIYNKKERLNEVMQQIGEIREIEGEKGVLQLVDFAENCFQNDRKKISEQLIKEASEKLEALENKSRQIEYYKGIILTYSGYFEANGILPVKKAVNSLEEARTVFSSLIEKDPDSKEKYYNRYLQSTELLIYELARNTGGKITEYIVPLTKELKERIPALKEEVFNIAKAYSYNEQITAIAERVDTKFR